MVRSSFEAHIGLTVCFNSSIPNKSSVWSSFTFKLEELIQFYSVSQDEVGVLGCQIAQPKESIKLALWQKLFIFCDAFPRSIHPLK